MLAQYVLLPQDGVVTFPEHLKLRGGGDASLCGCDGVECPSPCRRAVACSEFRRYSCHSGHGWSIYLCAAIREVAGSEGDRDVVERREVEARSRPRPQCGMQLQRAARLVKVGCGDHRRTRGGYASLRLGGARHFGQSLRAARTGGMVAQIGILSGAAVSDSLALTPILHKQLHVQGIYVGSRAMFEEMNAAIAKAKLRPVVDRSLRLSIKAARSFSAHAIRFALRQDRHPY